MKMVRWVFLSIFLLILHFNQSLLQIHAGTNPTSMIKSNQEVCAEFKIVSDGAILTDRNRKEINLSLPLRYTHMNKGGGTLTISHASNPSDTSSNSFISNLWLLLSSASLALAL